MQFICVVTAGYTLGFLMTENPWLVCFEWNTIFFNKNFYKFFFMEKALIKHFLRMEKCLSYNFIAQTNSFLLKNMTKSMLFKKKKMAKNA